MSRQGLPRRRAPDKAIQILQHSLLLGRKVGVPHHHQEDYAFFLGVISGPVQVARVHAKKPELEGDQRPTEESGGKKWLREADPENIRLASLLL